MNEYQNKNEIDKKKIEEKFKELQVINQVTKSEIEEDSFRKELMILFPEATETKIYRHIKAEQLLIEIFIKQKMGVKNKTQLEVWTKERINKSNIRFIYTLII